MNWYTWFARMGVVSVFIASVWDIELWRGAILAWALAAAKTNPIESPLDRMPNRLDGPLSLLRRLVQPLLVPTARSVRNVRFQLLQA